MKLSGNTLIPFKKNIGACIAVLLSIFSATAETTDGLFLHYDFETIQDTLVADASLNGNAGDLKGAAFIAEGQSGNGATFTGWSDYLQMPDNILNSCQSYSIACWVKMNGLSTWSRIFDFGAGQSYNIFMTPLSGGGNLRFGMKNGGGEELINAPSSLPTETWVHVAITYAWNAASSQGTGKLYVDGLMVASNTSMTINPSMLPPTNQNYIAKSQYTSDPAMNGSIDDFRIYNRSLAPEEIMSLSGMSPQLYNAYNELQIAGDLQHVKENLILPVVFDSDVNVKWTSSMPSVVSSEGLVNRPANYNQDVILTATLSMLVNGQMKTLKKDFYIQVISMKNEYEHWESMILETDNWNYLAANSAPPANWYQSTFDDSSWSTGPGGLGFADNDDNTVVVQSSSLYIRRKVTVSDLSLIRSLQLDIDYDDGFILYINGTERARSSNVSGNYPAYNASVTVGHEARMYSGGTPETFLLQPSMLQNGVNTFALQILNQSSNRNSDLSARVFVQARVHATNILYHDIVSWFVEPMNFEESNLPFVLINTNGQLIAQNNKINADMKIVDHPGEINTINDTAYTYNGKIGIEIRGFTSAGFPKKSYSIETRTDSATNLNVSLLGMPKENDWVFHGPYSDKSLMRNVLAYHLGNRTGHWSPRTRFFEMYINGAYQGIYVLVEKIKIDKNRMNLAKLQPADTIGDQLTGGYVMKLDRPESTDVEGINYWISPYRAWTALQQREYFIFHSPGGDELNNTQRKYIQQYITDFEDAMYSDDYKDRVLGYYPKIDLKSFVDYYILTELSRNLDGYRISTFMHKDKDSKGGKLTMGPYWDYNICFGNSNFFSAGVTSGWVIDGMGNADGYAMPFWWEKFRLDPYFNSKLKQEWNKWKENYLNPDYLNTFIDSCAYELIDAQRRNFSQWNVLNTYVWPNNYVGGTYNNELNYLKNWLSDRIAWMDSQIQPIIDVTVGTEVTQELPMDLACFPNPFIDRFSLKFYLNSSSDFQLTISDLMGRLVYENHDFVNSGLQQIDISASELRSESNVFLYQVKVNGTVRATGKIIKSR